MMYQSIAKLFYHLQPWVLPLIGGVLLLKLALFFAYKNPKWKYRHFFYFRSAQIVSSSSFEKVTIKIIQNCLSFYLLFLLAVKIVSALIL